MRRSRRDVSTVLIVLGLAGIVFLQIPFPVTRAGIAGESNSDRPSAAFVTLSPDEELRALRQAKSTLAADGGSPSHAVVADLILRSLPEDAWPAVLDEKAHTHLPDPTPVTAPLSPYLPSLAAPSAVGLPVAAEPAPQQAFSREELLKID